jgi:hypothetical protein
MNHVFHHFLCHFVLVFFDDILIYSKTWTSHLTHVDKVLNLLSKSTFVVECEVCQCNKGEIVTTLGTLQLLLIPPAIWRDISMDFIVFLPKSVNKSVIMVVVDRILKYDHLCPLKNPFKHPEWLKYSRIISSRFMAYLILFSLEEIPLSPVIFGKNCSSYRAPNCILAQPIIHIQMDKLKFSTSVWKHICGVLHLRGKIGGLSGYS